ncbi:SxtJ family membrane protein [Singulisphaera sp. PoT]|uniref:SxtJ family membrane protein n=1 Tax=Singulisphaera sp. PoT TaxID=3411797 RepID=UPI003BF491B0
MRWSDIPFAPPSRMLRQFSALWLVFFVGIAAWQGFAKGREDLAIGIAILAVAVGALGLIWPQAVRPIFVGWMILAFPIGWTVSLVLLGLVYFGLVLPTGLALRLSGRDVLGLKPRPEAETYWLPRHAPSNIRQYFRQF